MRRPEAEDLKWRLRVPREPSSDLAGQFQSKKRALLRLKGPNVGLRGPCVGLGPGRLFIDGGGSLVGLKGPSFGLRSSCVGLKGPCVCLSGPSYALPSKWAFLSAQESNLLVCGALCHSERTLLRSTVSVGLFRPKGSHKGAQGPVHPPYEFRGTTEPGINQQDKSMARYVAK